MNEMVRVSELERQHSAAVARQARLWGGRQQRAAKVVEVPDVSPETRADYEAQISSLRVNNNRLVKENTDLAARIKASESKTKSALAKEAFESLQKIRKLELDLADAHGRILLQAERISELSAIPSEQDTFPSKARRPVPAIVAEVLEDYPDISWEDIISVRRTRTLIEPRHACMRAVYEQRKDLSSITLGKIFKRDHTAILWAVGRLPGKNKRKNEGK